MQLYFKDTASQLHPVQSVYLQPNGGRGHFLAYRTDMLNANPQGWLIQSNRAPLAIFIEAIEEQPGKESDLFRYSFKQA